MHQTRSSELANFPTLALPYSWNTPRRSTLELLNHHHCGRARTEFTPSVMSCARERHVVCTPRARCDTSNIARSLHLRKTRWNATPLAGERRMSLSFGFPLCTNVWCTSDTNTHSFQLVLNFRLGKVCLILIVMS